MFRDRILVHKRYLGMSATTKSHLMEDHAVQQRQELHGCGDLGMDFGEREITKTKPKQINILATSEIL
jgi:hypothetical protein